MTILPSICRNPTVTGKIYQSTERTGADGRTINTANIGEAATCKIYKVTGREGVGLEASS